MVYGGGFQMGKGPLYSYDSGESTYAKKKKLQKKGKYKTTRLGVSYKPHTRLLCRADGFNTRLTTSWRGGRALV